MSIEIKVPAMGESVTEATVARWFKKEGEKVARDEALCELETDKVTVEVPAPSEGVLDVITVKEGETVEVGRVLGHIAEGANPGAASPKAPATPTVQPAAKAATKPAGVATRPPLHRGTNAISKASDR